MNRFLLALFASIALIAAAFTATSSAGLLYAPEYNADVINVFSDRLSSDGGLTAIGGSPFSIPGTAVFGWAMTPDAKVGVAAYLYGGVRSYSIAAAGGVTPAQDAINWSSQGAYSDAISPDGKSVYLATRPSPGPTAGIRGYSIAANGTLTEMTGSPFLALNSFLDQAITPNGKLLFGLTSTAIIHETLAPDGTLGSGGQQPVDNVSKIATSPDGRFLFATGTTGSSSEFKVFSIDADGNLTQVGSTVNVGAGSESPPAVAASGAFVYVADSNSDKVFTVRIGPDGTPSVIGALANVIDGKEVVASPDGKYLYVSSGADPYSINVSPIGPDFTPTGFRSTSYYRPYEGSRLFFRPGQGTNADFTAAADSKSLTMNFDASKTTPKYDAVGEVQWDFGDGTLINSTAGVTKHKFAKAGVYTVSLVAADTAGCGTKFVYTGQSTICNGSASSRKTITVDTPPWITALKVSPRKVKTKAKLLFRLTERAKVSLVVQRPTIGRTVAGTCKRQSAKNKKAKKCTRWVSASKPLKKSGKSGPNSIKFSGKFGNKLLANGIYRLAATATDSANGKSLLATSARFVVALKK
jgi:PKD repeat protein